MGLRTATLIAGMLAGAVDLGAQATARRLTTIEGLRQYPGYYHLQNVTLRGEFDDDGTRVTFRADGNDIRVLLADGARASSGPVEIRAQLIDVGRLEPTDPRVTPLAEGRGDVPWPRPGEELVARVTSTVPADPVTALTVRALALEPWRWEGQKVTVSGNFRGRNLFGDLPGAPGESRWDFVIRGAEGAIWVTGERPRGRGFSLDIDRRVDTDAWLEVSGVVVHDRGLVRIQATQLALAKAPEVTAPVEPETPPPPPPPLEVVFSSPTADEVDVSAAEVVRIQFSRGLDPKTLDGAFRVSYVGGSAAPPAFETTYDAANRAVALRFAEPLARFATVRVEVLDTLRAFDGGAIAGWTLTFSVGG